MNWNLVFCPVLGRFFFFTTTSEFIGPFLKAKKKRKCFWKKLLISFRCQGSVICIQKANEEYLLQITVFWLQDILSLVTFSSPALCLSAHNAEQRTYLWALHCTIFKSRWIAFKRWWPVWRHATPTCHSQILASGRWGTTLSSDSICFRISNPGKK